MEPRRKKKRLFAVGVLFLMLWPTVTVALASADPEPRTGDSSLTALWAVLCVVSLLGGAALIVTAIFKKKP